MKKLKSSFFILLFFAFGFTSSAQLSYGGGVSLNLKGSTYIGILGKVKYDITPEISASGDFTLWLEDFVDYSLNFNAYYKLLTLGESIEFSPMAGLNMTRVSVLGFGATDTNLQVGGNFRVPLGGMNVDLEPKIILGGGTGFQVSGIVMFGGGDD